MAIISSDEVILFQIHLTGYDKGWQHVLLDGQYVRVHSGVVFRLKRSNKHRTILKCLVIYQYVIASVM